MDTSISIIADRLSFIDLNRPIIIGITGEAATGKTTLGRNMVDCLGRKNSLLIDLDNYQYSRAVKQEMGVTGQHMKGTKRDKLRFDLRELKKERPVFKPRYEFKTGNILSEVRIYPKKHIFITGSSALFDGIREECDLTVFLDAPDSLLLARRLERDTKQRGYSVERVLRLFSELKWDYERFIEPARDVADIVLAVGI
jgi:phosphoribulokinase